MKIAIIGYGRMGKEIEKIALDRGHEIVLKTSNTPDIETLKTADVAIEFSKPETCFSNIKLCLENNINVICGTTGWLQQYPDAISLASKYNSGFLYASNFSIGVNIFFEINKKLAQLIGNFKEYNVELEEIHHTQKLDSPSGTAITIANGIIQNSDYNSWSLDEAKHKKDINIKAKRIEGVPGTHTVEYNSEVDSIHLTHTAHNRKGFALGAVLAAEFIKGKVGLFSMKDVLNIN